MIKKESFADYADSPEINQSFLKRVRKSPSTAFESEMKSTKSMDFGSLYHSFILEPDQFHNEHFVIDDLEILTNLIDNGAKSPKATKKYKEWVAEQEKEANGRIIVDGGEMKQLKDMKVQLYRNYPIAEAAILHSDHEVSIYQELHYSGGMSKPDFKSKCKCRIDGIIPEDGIIFDLKTSKDADPDQFWRDAGIYSYHIQAAFYKMLAEAEYQREFKFLYIVQEGKAPYNSAVYQVSEEMIEGGKEEIESLLKITKRIVDKDDGVFPSYNAFSGNDLGVYMLTIPKYYIKKYPNLNKG